MLFIKVPAIDGVPQVGTRHIYSAVSVSDTEAVCCVGSGPLKKGWMEIPEEEFRQYVPEPELQEPEPEPEPEPQPDKLVILAEAVADIYEEVLGREPAKLKEMLDAGKETEEPTEPTKPNNPIGKE